MADDRTRQFSRLLRLQQQLERLAQWRVAAARADRTRAEQAREAAVAAVESIRNEQAATLAADCSASLLLSGLSAERVASQRLDEARQSARQLAEVEQAEETRLQAARTKMKQWDKLTSLAREAQNEADMRSLQLVWDEFGARTHSLGRSQDPRNDDVREARELPA